MEENCCTGVVGLIGGGAAGKNQSRVRVDCTLMGQSIFRMYFFRQLKSRLVINASQLSE